MADVQNTNHQRQSTRQTGPAFNNSFLRKLQAYEPNSSQLIGILTLFISGWILLLLTGLTVTATILGFIFFAPLLILSSPIWVPIGTILFIVVGGFLSFCGFGIAEYGGYLPSKVKDAAPGA